jgi:TusA-related sulfurtransferase
MKRLDLRETIHAFALLKGSNAFGELKPGEALEILGSGAETSAEILKVLPPSSYEILLWEKSLTNASQFRIRLKKI